MAKIIKLSINPTESEEEIKKLKSYIAELINDIAETDRELIENTYVCQNCCIRGFEGDTYECNNCATHKRLYLDHIENKTREKYKYMLE